MRYLRPALVATFAALALGGCQQKKAAPPPAVPSPEQLAADAARLGPLAAAEPFEALTEGAFTPDVPALDKLIATATQAADHVKPALPPDTRMEMEARMQAIGAARRNDDRATIARSAIEVYRMLVEHTPPQAIPGEVPLLDYAGLRYDADLKYRTVPWDDMVDAAAFGQRTWSAIEKRVTDKSLHDRMSAALADMAAAAQAKDATRARAAVQRELDLVDLLEAFFSKPPA